jgi:HEPN domain-containing protein
MPGPNDWLRKAFSDLKLAQKGSIEDATLDTAVFLAHQVAEKSLNGRTRSYHRSYCNDSST